MTFKCFIFRHLLYNKWTVRPVILKTTFEKASLSVILNKFILYNKLFVFEVEPFSLWWKYKYLPSSGRV